VENMWDYPRPPAVEPCPRHVRVDLAGQILADSGHALRVLETSHPPTIYVPWDDVRVDLVGSTRPGSTTSASPRRRATSTVDGSAPSWSAIQRSAGHIALVNRPGAVASLNTRSYA
jgi:Domain of unknown function (DUF427)